jgi:hypothetical protein
MTNALCSTCCCGCSKILFYRALFRTSQTVGLAEVAVGVAKAAVDVAEVVVAYDLAMQPRSIWPTARQPHAREPKPAAR